MNMNNTKLLNFFHAGDHQAFAKAWDPAQRFSGGMPRSWMGWLLRDPEQRNGKSPGDLIPGGIKSVGAPDKQIGPFLDVVVGRSPELLSEPALAAWMSLAKTEPEMRARARRVVGLLDHALPNLSRPDASKLLGVYLGQHLRGATRKAVLDELTVDRLARWNSKSLLRPEFLLEHGGWSLDTKTNTAEGIALVDALLDRLGDVSRFVRTDIVPTELLKMFQGGRSNKDQQQVASHLLSRLMPLFKPEIQETIKAALRLPQVDDYRNKPTPAGLRQLAAVDPLLGYESKRAYESVGAVTLRAYARVLLDQGEASEAAGQWRGVIEDLGEEARKQLHVHLDGVIEDVIDAQVDRFSKLDFGKQMRKVRPTVQALRALHPEAPLAERSWAELAVGGAMEAQMEDTPTRARRNQPQRK